MNRIGMPILSLLGFALTLYSLRTPMADGTLPRHRSIAAPAVLLDSGQVHFGDRVCVHFRHSSITYTIRDRCPVNRWDLWTPKATRKARQQVAEARLTMGACPGSR